MPDTEWHYLVDQFDNVTKDSRPLALRIFADFIAKANQRQVTDSGLIPMNSEVLPPLLAWGAKHAELVSVEADYGAATAGFVEALRVLWNKPSLEVNSVLEDWDSQVRVAVPFGGTVYQRLFPHGREPFTAGTHEEIVEALRVLGQKLGVEGAKLVDGSNVITAKGQALVDLGVVVTARWVALLEQRLAQQGLEGQADALADDLEPLRVAACDGLHSAVGFLLWHHRTNKALVGSYFDLDALREGAPTPPPPPTP